MDLLDLAGRGKSEKNLFEEDTELVEEGQEGLMDSNCIEYRVNTSEGSIPLRLVSESTPSTQANTISTNVQAVLASPLNGQFYVIGSPSDVLGTVGQRNITPRFSQDGGVGAQQQHLKEGRQGNRRATHNEVERRRRENINHWIVKLGKLIPNEYIGVDNSQGDKHAQSKGGILAKACEYLAETRNTNENLRESLKSMEELTSDNERLAAEVQRLQSENNLLRQQLQKNDSIDFNI